MSDRMDLDELAEEYTIKELEIAIAKIRYKELIQGPEKPSDLDLALLRGETIGPYTTLVALSPEEGFRYDG